MKSLADADARDSRPVLLPAALLALIPVELRATLVERVADVGAGHRHALAIRTHSAERAIDRVVLLADLDAVDLELARGAVHQRLHDAGQLVLTRTALRGARRCIGEHRRAAPAHG